MLESLRTGLAVHLIALSTLVRTVGNLAIIGSYKLGGAFFYLIAMTVVAYSVKYKRAFK